MIYSFTRIASLALVFGFFISCSSTSNINSQTSTKSLSETGLEQKIQALSQKITSGDSSATLFYKKGLYLTKLAQQKEKISSRKKLYADAHYSLQQSAEKSEIAPHSIRDNRALELLNVTWSNEHNQGVQIMQSDSTLDNSQYKRAAAHFKNATVIIPDSTISYKMGARAYYKSQQSGKAIEILEQARHNNDKIPTGLLEQLAFLYLQNDRAQQAVTVYEEADSFSNQNLNLLHGLSNAYITVGQHQKAMNLLQILIDQKPENIIYRQSLATELYYLASQKIDSTVNHIQKDTTAAANTYQSADSLLSRAERHLSALAEKNSNLDLQKRLAHFYHNSATKYQQLLPLVGDKLKSKISKRIEHFVSSSLPFYKKLAEKNPDKKIYRQNLYRAYSYLGMEKQARKAKSNL